MTFADHAGRVRRGLLLLILITIVGFVGYLLLGLSALDALYQTVITISTVGYREVGVDEESAAYRLFTIFVILGGVGTAFYTLGVLLETLIEGRLTDQLWRRRMERTIAAMSDHVIVCGWGRVGRTIARDIAAAGKEVVVIDIDPERLLDLDLPFVEGDATDDAAGSGTRRKYSYKDLLELKVIKRLLDAGIKLESIRDAFDYLREQLGEDVASAHLVISGSSAVLVREGELVDVVNRYQGQGVLNLLPMDGVLEELDAAVATFEPTLAEAGAESTDVAVAEH